MTECIFCRIARKEAPASIVYEDDDVIAFLDINPIAEGHALVIPKKHVVNIFDIDSTSLQRCVTAVKRVTTRMRRVLLIDGVNLVNASGRAAEQDVAHFHIHVIPRREEDELGFHEWWLRKIKRSNREELDRLAAKLRRDYHSRGATDPG